MAETNGFTDNRIELYSNSPREAEAEDDYSNSGVFGNGRANVHKGDGVFATQFALPGYAARENLMGKSEVIDRQTGTEIEVYVGGATSAAQYMPGGQPRNPWPDQDGYLGGAVNKAHMQDSGQFPVQDISNIPADFVGPVADTMSAHDNDRYPWTPQLGGRRGPWLGSMLPDGLPLPPNHGTPRWLTPLDPQSATMGKPFGGGGPAYDAMQGLGSLTQSLSEPWILGLPFWQGLILAAGAGIVARLAWDEFGKGQL